MTLRSGIAADYFDFLNQLESALCGEGHAWGLLYVGTGNGALTGKDGAIGSYRGGGAAVAEAFTITAIDANRFQVTGSVAGDSGVATVDQPFENERLRFLIKAGSIAFVAGDSFTLNTSPPWTLVRRIGVRNPTLRTGNFSNLDHLFDGTVDTFGSCPVANLPAVAGIEMIGSTAVRAITLGVADAINRGVSAFELQSSVDGSTWTTVQGWTGVRWVSVVLTG